MKNEQISLCSSEVEHFLGKEEVPGSIPGKGSTANTRALA